MAVTTADSSRHPLDFKSAQIPVLAVVLKTTSVVEIARHLALQVTQSPDFFDNAPVLIDLTSVHDTADGIDFVALTQTLRAHAMQPVAVRGGNAAHMTAAHAAGLADAAPLRLQPPREIIHEVVREVEVVREIQVPASRALVLEKPLRSGQNIHARGGDLIVFGGVNFGADVSADGNIHVYGPLRGRALAGAHGDENARIFSTCMQAQLLSIAGLYRTSENPFPPHVLGQCVQVRRKDRELLIEPL